MKSDLKTFSTGEKPDRNDLLRVKKTGEAADGAGYYKDSLACVWFIPVVFRNAHPLRAAGHCAATQREITGTGESACIL